MLKRTVALALIVATALAAPSDLRAQVSTSDMRVVSERLSPASVARAPRALSRASSYQPTVAATLSLMDSHATCDAAKFKAAEARRSKGAIWALGGLVAGIAGTYKFMRYDGEGSLKTPIVLTVGGAIAEIVGMGMMKSTVSTTDFENAVQTVRIGETKMADIMRCMGTPKSKTFGGEVETALYEARDSRGVRIVVFTATDGVVSNLNRINTQR